jgi:hypothetical protein
VRLATAEGRRRALVPAVFAEMKTAYIFGRFTARHRGDTPAAAWALNLLQRYVWTDGTSGTRSSRMRKFDAPLASDKRSWPVSGITLCVSLHM